MTTVKQQRAIPPTKIQSVLHGVWAGMLLKAAVRSDIVEPLERGAKTADQVAQEKSYDKRGTEAVLDALVGMELLAKSGDKYELNDSSRAYLLKSSVLYMGGFIARSDQMINIWEGIPDMLKSGKPEVEVNKDDKAQEFFPALAAGIFPLSYTFAQDVAEYLKLSGSHRVLDVACGSCVWSIPLAEGNKNVKVDALDFPAVLTVAKEFTKRHKVFEQYQFLSGNWRDITLEDDSYDVICLGHILHSEGLDLSKDLLAKCFKALKKGGRLMIAEFMPNDDKKGPAAPLLFGVNMYVMTTDGCVFTKSELGEMLKASGYTKVDHHKGEGYESPVLIATK